MNEAEFNQIVDDVMFIIEETIDDSGAGGMSLCAPPHAKRGCTE